MDQSIEVTAQCDVSHDKDITGAGELPVEDDDTGAVEVVTLDDILGSGEFVLTMYKHVEVSAESWEGPSERYMEGKMSEREWGVVVQDALRRADAYDILHFILPNCLDNWLDSILETMVQRQLWDVVREMLLMAERGLTERGMLQAVREIGRLADDDVLHYRILPRLQPSMFSVLLEPVVFTRKWKTAEKLLSSGTIEDVTWVTNEAYIAATDELDQCTSRKEREKREHLVKILYRSSFNRMNRVLMLFVKRTMFEDGNVILSNLLHETLFVWAGNERASDDEPFWELFHACQNDLGLCQYIAKAAARLGVPKNRLNWDSRLFCCFLKAVAFLLSDQYIPENVSNKGCEYERRIREVNSHKAKEIHLFEHIFDFLRKRHLSPLAEKDAKDELYGPDSHSEFKVDTEDNADSNPEDNADSDKEESGKENDAHSSEDVESTDHGESGEAAILKSVIDQGAAWSHNLNVYTTIFHLQTFVKQYHVVRCQLISDAPVMRLLTLAPVLPLLQSVLLMKEKDWSVISQADLSHVWEDVRGQLFLTAIKEKRWGVVCQWADHSLYDNERGFAVREAYSGKQWRALMLLADHGLTEGERMRVHYRLGKYADWDLVLELLDRGGDIAELTELLAGNLKRSRRQDSQLYREDYTDRHQELQQQEDILKACSKKPLTLRTQQLTEIRWRQVWAQLKWKTTTSSVCRVLDASLEEDEEFVAMELARKFLTVRKRNSLFPEMVKRRWWGACRVLLERGIHTQTCVATLQDLLQHGQWTLVARVMEYDVGDAQRRRVLHQALSTKQGSVVSHCLRTMQSPFTVAERDAMFQRALSQNMWEAVKALVEEADAIGIAHRDTALRAAMDCHRWDVVDHCERFFADLNIKDDDGQTYLAKMATKRDWEAVEALTRRGVGQCLSKHERVSEMTIACLSKRWDIVKLLVQYHGDVNYVDEISSTPWMYIIDAEQTAIISETLFWGCGVTEKTGRGVTALHAVCKAGDWETMYYLVARGVDPLAVTAKGQSVLMYSVEHETCSQHLLAECIKLGFSTFQPAITDAWFSKRKDSFKPPAQSLPWGGSPGFGLPGMGLSGFGLSGMGLPGIGLSGFGLSSSGYGVSDMGIAGAVASLIARDPFVQTRSAHNRAIYTSPFEYALVCNLQVLRDMLYDSGACSNKELLRLYRELLRPGSLLSNKLKDDERKSLLPYLKRVATTPRRLDSLCRLAISHCLGVYRKRHRAVLRLPLEKQETEDYILFKDLTDPIIKNWPQAAPSEPNFSHILGYREHHVATTATAKDLDK